MSKSFMPSMIWPSSAAKPVALQATDEPLANLPEHEQTALTKLVELCNPMIAEEIVELPDCDQWKLLMDGQHEELKCEILLRFLRYNALSVDKAYTQMQAAIRWRVKTDVASLSNDVFGGTEVGIPIVQITPKPNDDGDVLYVSLGEAYVKREIVHPKQEIGVGKLFDYILYDVSGPMAKNGFIVLDFTNLSIQNIDLVSLKNGCLIFLNYFPDIFRKILLVNYHRVIYGVWKFIQPVLDSRTKSRIVWVETHDQLKSIIEASFDMDEVPQWLGGNLETDQVTLYSGKTFSPSYLTDRFK